jgi:hypothetical protein
MFWEQVNQRASTGDPKSSKFTLVRNVAAVFITRPNLQIINHNIYKFLITVICQWLAAGRWFSSSTPVPSTNKTDHHDIAEILRCKDKSPR